MTRKRYYRFKFTDSNRLRHMTVEEAVDYIKANDVGVVVNGYQNNIESPTHRIRDGFQGGWQPGLGDFANTRLSYERKCKAAGLVEMGKDYKGTSSHKKVDYFSQELGEELHEAGMGDDQIDVIKESVS